MSPPSGVASDCYDLCGAGLLLYGRTAEFGQGSGSLLRLPGRCAGQPAICLICDRSRQVSKWFRLLLFRSGADRFRSTAGNDSSEVPDGGLSMPLRRLRGGGRRRAEKTGKEEKTQRRGCLRRIRFALSPCSGWTACCGTAAVGPDHGPPRCGAAAVISEASPLRAVALQRLDHGGPTNRCVIQCSGWITAVQPLRQRLASVAGLAHRSKPEISALGRAPRSRPSGRALVTRQAPGTCACPGGGRRPHRTR